MSEPPANAASSLPAVVAVPGATPSRPKAAAGGAFDAQVLGQGGARRGLKGGAPVLDQAQHAYLEAEWSGPANRRTPAGAKRRERI